MIIIIIIIIIIRKSKQPMTQVLHVEPTTGCMMTLTPFSHSVHTLFTLMDDQIGTLK